MKKEKKNNESDIESKLRDNPMFDSLVSYFLSKAPGGRIGKVRITEDDSVLICKMRYGKATLYFDVYVDSKGAVSTMVFDFRDIYDKYVVKKTVETHGDDYADYAFKILHQTKFGPEYVCVFGHYKGGIIDDEEEYEAFGISLVGYTNENFNLFTPWAGVLDEILNAVDEVNGFVGDEKKNKLTRKDVDEAAVRYPLRFWFVVLLGYVAIVGGPVFIITNKTWIPFFKWLVGIILVLAGLFFGPIMHFSVRSDKKNYYANSGEIRDKFHTAVKKRFPTIKD